jgi:hypothetical protein
MHGLLDSISQQKVLTFAKKVRKPWETFAAVTLTDGATIVAHLGGSRLGHDEQYGQDYAQFIPTTGTWRFQADGNLVMCHRDLYNELQFYIPFTDVAGIRQIHIDQPEYRKAIELDHPGRGPSLFEEYLSQFSEDERPVRAAIREQRSQVLLRASERRVRELQQLEKQKLTSSSGVASADELPDQGFLKAEFEDLEFNIIERKLEPVLRSTAVRTAQSHHYHMDLYSLGVAYSIASTLTFTGDLEPKPGERLYVDWDYVSRNRKGLNGAGFGFIVSLSLSWNTSQAGAAKLLAKKPLTKISDVCRNDLTLLRGHVAFVEVPGSTVEHTTIKSRHKLSIDGGTWRAAIITALPIVNAPGKDTPWVLSYWKEGGDEVPFELLDTSVIPLDIFASRHSGKLTTSFGKAECFLKVHYAQAAGSGPRVWTNTMSPS